ncbi:MAG: sulfatase-like hydrolase/transferase [Cyclobacteriaceae bacterium]
MKLKKLAVFAITCAHLSLISNHTMCQDEKPNILLIMTDQQVWNALGYSGNDEIITPNMDRLAEEGAYFEQAVTPCAVCVPARTAIHTGRLLETNEVRSNRDVVKDINSPTFDQLLVKEGYTSEYYGKYHAPKTFLDAYSNPVEDGTSREKEIIEWEQSYVEDLQEKHPKRKLKKGELYETTFYGGTIPYEVAPLDRRYGYLPTGKIPDEELDIRIYGQGDVHGVLDLPVEETITAVQGRFALDALDRLKDDKFILTCSFHCPHVPITPAAEYVSMYDKSKITVPKSIQDPNSNTPYKPTRFQEKYKNKEMVKDMVVNYYAFVTEIDDWVGKILDKLDQLNLTDNTMVIFVSDHGEMLGAHGMRGKFNFYEESVRVPFFFKLPGKIAAGQRFDFPVSTLNIFPTILDYTGITSVSNDGFSLRGVIEGGAPKYEYAVTEWDWKNLRVPSLMIKTRDWKLMTTHRKGGPNVDCLYDLKNDPYEMNNLIGSNPDRFQHAKTVERLREKLLEYLEDVNSPLIDGVRERVLIRN